MRYLKFTAAVLFAFMFAAGAYAFTPEEIQEKARLESQTSFEKAKANIELEIQKARLTLRQEIADLSIRVAEKILTEKMDHTQQEKKALEILGELEKKL